MLNSSSATGSEGLVLNDIDKLILIKAKRRGKRIPNDKHTEKLDDWYHVRYYVRMLTDYVCFRCAGSLIMLVAASREGEKTAHT